jgi:LmbE family N-acetylglucosaminyl deacetylase
MVLVVAAHPDDEVLGCGATVARLAGEGHPVHIAILGEGISSRYRRREDADPAELDALQACSRRASEALGATALTALRLPDNRFDTVPFLDIVHLVERVLDDVGPSVVYTHHPGDLNIDHVITFRAVLTATRPISSCLVRDLYSFEVPSSTEWAFERGDRGFRPNVFFDVSATIETKVRAMALYEGECRAFPHPRSPEVLRAIAQRWGSVAGVSHAEAFELIRAVR